MDLTVNEIVARQADATGKAGKGKTGNAAYDVDLEDDWDTAFAIFCFFEDVHRLESSLVNLWQRQRDGLVELVTATVTTTAAWDLLNRTETELYSRLPGKTSGGSLYNELSLTIFYAECFRSGEDPEARLGTASMLKITPFDEFIYLPTARVLVKFAKIQATVHDKTAWPPPVIPMRFNYIIDPGLLDTPEMRKYEEEDRLLSQLLLDRAMTEELHQNIGTVTDENMARFLPPVEDVLSKYLRKIWKSGNVTVTSVSSCKIFGCPT